MLIGALGPPGHLATNNVEEGVKRGQDSATTLHKLMVDYCVLDLAVVVGAVTHKLVRSQVYKFVRWYIHN